MTGRFLTAADLPEAVDLSTLAGWNQTAEDWAMLLDLAPQSCFAIEMEGQVAATCTLICYGARLAWLGMVLTRPEFRGRGFARSLVETALAFADRQGVRSVLLDATDMGRPVYRKLGFQDQQDIERWARGGPPAEWPEPPAAPSSIADIPLLDERVYLADRSRLLTSLIARGAVFHSANGFLLARPGRLASFLGPCVADSAEAAASMIGQCFNSRPSSWFWDLLHANERAAALAERFGFERVRRLTRMVRGEQILCRAANLWATAGFELG